MVPDQLNYPDEYFLQILPTEEGERALELIFRRYYQFVCNTVFRVLSDENTAEDIAQDVFIEIWKRRQDLKITTSLKAYLRKAAVNKTLNFIRNKKWNFGEDEILQETPDQTIRAQQHLELNELENLVTGLIDRLPERCRAVFMLSRYEELSYQEIADQLGISTKTVENQISKALKFLRLHLGSIEDT